MMNNLLNAIVCVALLATFFFASDLGPGMQGVATSPAAPVPAAVAYAD